MFFVPAGSTEAVDTCDIILASATSPITCSVNMANGSALRVAASAEAFNDQVNALYPEEAPYMIGPFTVGGEVCYVAGNKVVRVAPNTLNPAHSVLTLWGTQQPIRVGFTRDQMVTALNTISGGCDGGGGEPSAPPSGYGTAGYSWLGPLTTGTGVSAVPDNSMFTRQGAWSETPQGPQAGDIMHAQAQVWCVIQPGNPLSFSGSVAFIPDAPPIANGQFSALWSASRISGDAFDAEVIRFNRTGNDTFACTTNDWVAVAETTIRLVFELVYVVAGV